MKGEVVEINRRRGLVAVLTEDGDYSIIELLGDDLDVGDEVAWHADSPLGGETINNMTQGVKMEVFFQNHCVPENQLRQQLQY
jgi:hypothetical protein